MAFFQKIHICVLQISKVFNGLSHWIRYRRKQPLCDYDKSFHTEWSQYCVQTSRLIGRGTEIGMWKIELDINLLPPSLNIEFESYVKRFTELHKYLTDVLTGFLPMIPAVVTSSFDAKVPICTYQWQNVCCLSKSYSRNGKVTDNFLVVCLVVNGPCAVANHSRVLVCR